MTPLRVFIGYDSREPVAYHVLAHSIQKRASWPVLIAPVALWQVESIYKRPISQQSTEFTYSRFLVPYLSNYSGYSVFIDSDMLCLGDVHELEWLLTEQPEASIAVVKHDYEPKPGIKFLGNPQVAYPRKNWSSVMVFNNVRCQHLTPDYVNQATGAQLHRFEWLRDQDIGELPLEWNYLVGEYSAGAKAKLLHYTQGGPWFPEYEDCDYADEWFAELDALLHPVEVK